MEWILIASRIEANFFRHTKDGSLKLFKTLSNPMGRLRNRKFQYDKPGMSRAKFKGSSPHRLGAEKNLHDDVASQFAKEMVEYLKRQWYQNHNLKFRIVAEPRLLGLIRTQFGKSKILNQISWLERDLQNVPPNKWPEILSLERIPMKKDMEAPHLTVI